MEQTFSFTLDYKDTLHTEEDLRLSLLAGATVRLGNLEIQPYSLEEIIKVGYSKYLSAIKLLMLEPDDFKMESISPVMVQLLQENKVYTTFDLYNRFLGEQNRQVLIDGLKIIFKTEDIIAYDDKDYMSIGEVETLDENSLIINRENFDKIMKVVKLQNYLDMNLTDAIQDEANPKDEQTRQLLEIRKKMREKLKKANSKNRDDDGNMTSLDFSSIVSAVTVKSQHINKLNVWGMTLYQVYDEYNRLMMIDDYDTNIKAIMAGAKDVDLTHWSSLPDK